MATIHFKGKSYVQNHHLTLKYHHLVANPDASLTNKVSLHDNLIIHGNNLPDLNYLLSTAFDLDKAEALGQPKANSKTRLVFAPMKYLDNNTLLNYRVEYCQLPFEIYKFK
jgi:adenine-specific DNA-methyltransferase